MTTLLIRNAACLATFDDQRSEWRDASLLARDGFIEAIGPAHTLPHTADEVIDARHHLVLPGLVNTHHHMYQSLTRALPIVPTTMDVLVFTSVARTKVDATLQLEPVFGMAALLALSPRGALAGAPAPPHAATNAARERPPPKIRPVSFMPNWDSRQRRTIQGSLRILSICR